jgi:hypothetical protein
MLEGKIARSDVLTETLNVPLRPEESTSNIEPAITVAADSELSEGEIFFPALSFQDNEASERTTGPNSPGQETNLMGPLDDLQYLRRDMSYGVRHFVRGSTSEPGPAAGDLPQGLVQDILQSLKSTLCP